jgi:hypothetical protein
MRLVLEGVATANAMGYAMMFGLNRAMDRADKGLDAWPWYM